MVRISYSVVVEVPPRPPSLAIQHIRQDSAMLVWTGAEATSLGYILSYRPAGGQVHIIVISSPTGQQEARYITV